jgi:hypothetical protein
VCAECDRLWFESAALLLEYNAALDVLEMTSSLHDAYADRWMEVADVSERLDKAQRLAGRHRDSHERR